MVSFIRSLVFAANFMILVIRSSADLEEPNVQTEKEKYEQLVNVTEREQLKNDSYHIEAECIMHRKMFNVTKKTKLEFEVKSDKKCSKGHGLTRNGSKCVPVCSQDCVHGKCVAPDECKCENGYGGFSCEIAKCSPEKWGPNCEKNCNCANGAATCDSITGECNCTEGWTGKQCERKCSSNRYGKDCGEWCRCNNGGSCHRVTGECYCAPGYTGPLCDDLCPVDTYGDDCKMKCKCQNGGLCNAKNGNCSCTRGWIGRVCAYRCPDGYWGKNCQQKCNCHNDTGCHHVTGNCVCEPGYHGKQCLLPCPKDKYGVDCTKNCNCQNDATCSPIDGSCTCNDSWEGENCEKRKCPDNLSDGNCSKICENENCTDHTFGEDCTLKCSCENGATCSIENGGCKCTEEENGDVHFQFGIFSQHWDFICGSTGVGILAAIIVMTITLAAWMCHRRRVANLKMEIAHAQYIAEPMTPPDRDQFDNPVYSHEGDTRTDDNSTTLLNNGLIRNNLGMKNVKNERSKLSPDSCTNEGDDSCKGVCGVRCDDRATSSKNKDGGSSKSIENHYQSIDEINRGKIGDDLYVEMKPSNQKMEDENFFNRPTIDAGEP